MESANPLMSQMPMDDGMLPRDRVAMALQMQRGLFPKNQVANMGNQLLQMWNMTRGTGAPPPRPPDPVMGTGFPIQKDPVMGTGY